MVKECGKGKGLGERVRGRSRPMVRKWGWDERAELRRRKIYKGAPVN